MKKGVVLGLILFGIFLVSLGFLSATPSYPFCTNGQGDNCHCDNILGMPGPSAYDGPAVPSCTDTTHLHCDGSTAYVCVSNSGTYFRCNYPSSYYSCYVAPSCNPSNGYCSAWSIWGACSATCGGGIQTRTRTYTAPSCGGSNDVCRNSLTETQTCNTQACCVPAVEICNGVDDNCDSIIDEGCSLEVTINSPSNQNYNNYTQLVNITTQGIWPAIWFNWDGVDVLYNSPVLVDFYEGTNILTAYVNDTAGNINSTSVTFLIDTSAPLVTIENPLNNELSSDINLPINYIASDMNLDSCWWTNELGVLTNFVSCLDNITGEIWSDGSHSVTVYANDSANNLASANVNFNIDSTAPAITILNPVAGGIFGGNIMLRAAITDINLDASTLIYELRENGVAGVINSSGSLIFDGTNYGATFLTDSSWPTMNLTLVVYANDTLGHLTTASVDFILDNTLPTITFITPAADNSSIFNSNFNLNVLLSGYQLYETAYRLDDSLGNPIVANYTLLSQDSYTLGDLIDISALPDGIYTLSVSVNDSSNPINAVDGMTFFVIDTIAPNLIVNSPSGSYNTTIINFDVTSDEQARECNYSIDSGDSVEMTSSDGLNFVHTNSSMSEGLHNVLFMCWDNAGNSNTATSSFLVDSIIPAIQFVAPTESSGYLNRNNIQINVSASDANLSSLITEFYNDLGTLITSNSLEFNDFTGLLDGSYSFISTACDIVGNCNSTELRNVIIDTFIPTLNFIYPQDVVYNSENVTFDLTLDESGVCYYSLNNGVNITMTDMGRNSFESIIVGLGQGNQTVVFSCTDSAGNWGFGELNFSVDTIPPSITAIEPYNGQTFNTSEIFLNITGDGTEQSIWFNDGVSDIAYTGPAYYNFSEGLNNLTIYLNDSVGNVHSENLVFTVSIEKTIVNSWIYGIFYLLNSTSQVTTTTVIDSTVNDSIIDGSPVANITISNIINSTLTDVTVIDHCTALNSIVTGGICSYTTIDPSNVTADDTTGSIITDSFVYYYSVTWSNETNCINWYSIVNNSVIVNTNKTYANIYDSHVTDSVIINSTIINSRILNSEIILSWIINSNITDSYVYNSNITDSTITNSDIIDSTITNSTVIDSIVTDSNITNSIVINSTITNSNITDSIVTDSNITNSIVINSSVTNTNISNMIVIDANITDGTVYWGNITSNGTSTIIIPGSPVNLTDLINYAPVAVLNVALTNYVGDNVLFYGSSSHDVNVGTLLNDSLIYEFGFGEGANSVGASNSASHTYSTVGNYNASLKVTDKYGESSMDSEMISIIVRPTAPSSGGGGSSGSCITEWKCSIWSNCLNYNQTRNCAKIKSYCYAGTRPSEIRSCVPSQLAINGPEIIFPSMDEVQKFQNQLLGQARQSKAVWYLILLLFVIIIIAAIIVYIFRDRLAELMVKKDFNRGISPESTHQVIQNSVQPVASYEPRFEKLPVNSAVSTKKTKVVNSKTKSKKKKY